MAFVSLFRYSVTSRPSDIFSTDPHILTFPHSHIRRFELMDVEQLRQILDLVSQHDVSEIEIEHEGLRLRIRKSVADAPAPVPVHGALHGAAPVPTAAVGATEAVPVSVVPASAAERIAAEDIELAIVKSPIVGTFYRSSEPNAPPFVE